MGSGGAIFASMGAALVLQNCSFENCQSLAHAGHLDSLYQGGGAIFVEGTGVLAVEGSSFTKCQAPHGAGGAILIQASVGNAAERLLSVSSTRFDECNAAVTGGGVAIVVSSGSGAGSGAPSERGVLLDATNFTKSKLRGNHSYGGALYLRYYGVPAANLVNEIRECRFEDAELVAVEGGAINSVGGAGIWLRFDDDGAFNVTTIVSSCSFLGNRLAAGPVNGYAQGGGVHLQFDDAATNIITRFVGCTFSRNTLYLTAPYGAANGGGIIITHFGVVHNITTQVRNCSFSLNKVVVSEHGTAAGGGLYMGFLAAVSHAQTLIESCAFSSNTLDARAGNWAKGGGVNIYYLGDADDLFNLFSDCSFSGNAVFGGGGGGTDEKYAYGGAIYMDYGGSVIESVATRFSRCRFDLNRVLSEHVGLGGAIYHESQPRNVSISLSRSSFVRNFASGSSGAIHLVQWIPNPPANLLMNVIPCRGCAFPFTCEPNVSGVAREWDYSAGVAVIESTEFVGNDAGGSNCSWKTYGGALHVTELATIIRDSRIVSNHACSSGGGIYIGRGSGSIMLVGNTTVSNNTAAISGSAIYSGSSAGIDLLDTATFEFTSGRGEVSGLEMIFGGKLKYSPRSQLLCPAGEALVDRTVEVVQSLSDWRIDCELVRADTPRPGSAPKVSYANRACDPLANGTALQTLPCAGIPLTPAMLTTTGAILCSPCPPRLYSLDRGGRFGNGSATVKKVDCKLCPVGADCSEGGAQIRVKPGFWTGIGNDVVPCPYGLGLCCDAGHQGPNSSSCRWDSPGACKHHHDPSSPLCAGCVSGYSQAVDGIGCVEDSLCGSGRVAAFFLAELVRFVGYSCYALYQARDRAILALLPQGGRPAGVRNSGAFAAVVYFAQLVVVVVPQDSFNSMASGMVDAVGVVVGMSASSRLHEIFEGNEGGSACLAPGSTMVHRLVWEVCGPLVTLLIALPATKFLVLPALLAVLTTLGALGSLCCHHLQRFMSSTAGDDAMNDVTEPLMAHLRLSDQDGDAETDTDGGADGNADGDSDSTSSFTTAEEDEEEHSCSRFMYVTAEEERTQKRKGRDEVDLTLRVVRRIDIDSENSEACDSDTVLGKVGDSVLSDNLAGAVACLLLFEFTFFAEAVLRLLYCESVHIEKHHQQQRVLFFAGDTACALQWQWPLVIILIALTLAPLLPVCVWLLCRATVWPVPPSIVDWARAQRWPQRPVWIVALKELACAPFVDEKWHWTAVLMLQRLLTVMCRSFATEPVDTALGVTVVSFWCVLFHLLGQPYRLARVNRLQLVASVCLALISVLNVASSAFRSVGFDTSGSNTPAKITRLVHSANWCMFLLLLPPPLLWAHMPFVECWRWSGWRACWRSRRCCCCCHRQSGGSSSLMVKATA
jgi:hypothetical protein